MAVDMFMKIDGIDGESKDAAHTKEIDVLSWSWGMSQAGTFHHGAGGGAGKVNVTDLSFVKYVDSASHALQLSVCNGNHISEATLTVRKAGKKPLEYIIIVMKKLMITSVSTGGSGGEDKLTETVCMNFAECEYAYTPQKDDGTGDTPLEYGWNIETNEQTK